MPDEGSDALLAARDEVTALARLTARLDGERDARVIAYHTPFPVRFDIDQDLYNYLCMCADATELMILGGPRAALYATVHLTDLPGGVFSVTYNDGHYESYTY